MNEQDIIAHIKKKEWAVVIPQIISEETYTDTQRDKLFNTDLNGLERMSLYREILKSTNSKYDVQYFLILN